MATVPILQAPFALKNDRILCGLLWTKLPACAFMQLKTVPTSVFIFKSV
jgi:hypothetical protein